MYLHQVADEQKLDYKGDCAVDAGDFAVVDFARLTTPFVSQREGLSHRI